MSGGTKVRRHVLVSGHVQGVWFRDSCRKEAERLRVNGWVKNLDDGRLEAVFEGDPDAVAQMLAWCRHGPSNARVDQIQVASEPATGEFLRFQLIR